MSGVVKMENETSPGVGSTFQKADLNKLSFEKGAINFNVWDDPCSEYKRNGCDVAGLAGFLHPCKYCQFQPQHDYCTVDPASIRDHDMQNGLVCTQCCDKEKSRGSLCKLNRQASGEVAWVPKRRAKQTIPKKNMFLVNVPPCSQETPDMAMKQHSSLIGFLQDPHRDNLRHRITLPPKKRICMNMELSAAQPRDRTLSLAEEVCMASKHADPPTFSMGSIEYDVKHNDQGEARKIVKSVGTTSSSISVETDGSTKDMKSSKLLLRRYKLLSEIV